MIRAVFANTAARIGTQESWDARIEAVRTSGMKAIQDMVLARFLSEGFRRKQPEVVRNLGKMLEATNPRGYIGACAALSKADLRRRLAGIHIPSLIITGEPDVSTPPSQARELHAAIPGSELLVISNVGHLSNVEQPEQFSKAVLDFLVRS
jgi:3-oxoadipate enol-lactonase